MINIYEHQYEKGNKDNKQERVIVYSDFDSYERDLLCDNIKAAYPSLPRQAEVLNHHRNGNAITLEFFHPLMNCAIVHIAVVTQ